MFDEEYLDSLPDEPVLAIGDVVNKAIDHWAQLDSNQEHQEFEFFLEAFAITKALLDNIPEISIEQPKMEGTPQDVVTVLNEYFNSLKSAVAEQHVLIKSAQFTAKYQAKYGNSFSYEFSDGDLEKIQELINKLRGSISASDIFEQDHKARLLARLEKIQSELHKKMADLDRLWGLVGDAGVAIGKFGKDAKPIVDRIREISDIVWRTQSRAEELPSDTPMELISNSSEEA
ncbi:MAG: hypothetical protein AB9Q19_14525 [Candidatus Reddybacter sp.]